VELLILGCLVVSGSVLIALVYSRQRQVAPYDVDATRRAAAEALSKDSSLPGLPFPPS
jgi:hypothetical protein